MGLFWGDISIRIIRWNSVFIIQLIAVNHMIQREEKQLKLPLGKRIYNINNASDGGSEKSFELIFRKFLIECFELIYSTSFLFRESNFVDFKTQSLYAFTVNRLLMNN